MFFFSFECVCPLMFNQQPSIIFLDIDVKKNSFPCEENNIISLFNSDKMLLQHCDVIVGKKIKIISCRKLNIF